MFFYNLQNSFTNWSYYFWNILLLGQKKKTRTILKKPSIEEGFSENPNIELSQEESFKSVTDNRSESQDDERSDREDDIFDFDYPSKQLNSKSKFIFVVMYGYNK